MDADSRRAVPSGTSGSVSIVSSKPDDATSRGVVVTTTERSSRKREIIGATIVAAALVAAVRLVPRRPSSRTSRS